MKKSVKVILVITGVLVIAAGIFAYHVYQMVSGAEEIEGRRDQIPTGLVHVPLSKGDSDWPNWRGVNFDGKSLTKGIITDWGKGLKKLWQADYLCQGNATASWSAPVVSGNRLVIPGRDDKKDLIFCINSENGKLIWTGSYDAEAETSHGPGSRATPFIDSNRVYTFGRSGDLVCWQLEDGKLLWRQNVKTIGGREPQWGYSTTPLVLDNTVIVQGGGTVQVIAYDKMTGNILWKSLQGEAGYAAAIPVVIENEKKLIVYHGLGLSCLEPADGKELWRVPWKTEYAVNATTPVIDGDILFHTSAYGMGGQALQLNKTGFKVIWKNNVFAAQHSDPVIIDGYVYGYAGDANRNKGLFKCMELKSGREMWATKEIGAGTTAYADGYLICFDLKGNLYLVKPDPKSFIKTGEIKQAIEDVTNLSWTVPVVANGKLYLRYMQHLVCYNLMP